MKLKVYTSIKDLCKGFPNEFVTYIDYCRHLNFDEKPDYSYLKNMFKDLFIKSVFENDYMYDWVPILQEKNFNEKMDVSVSDLQKNEKANPIGSKLANDHNDQNISNNMVVNSSQIKKDENAEENNHNDETKVIFYLYFFSIKL